uniref:Cytochrome b-c1 complex subunit 10 n=1 Tax=Lygus hesperus TaxID=30085 RepID=A0A0K8T4Q7_LYGHE
MSSKFHKFSTRYLGQFLTSKQILSIYQTFRAVPAVEHICLSMAALKLPDLSKHFGPKHQEIAKKWMPTVVVYTATGFLLTCYICEWEAVLKYVPVWNRKYDKKD